MRMLDALVRTSPAETEERGWGFDPYLLSMPWSTYGSGSLPQQTDGTFESLVDTVHRKNGIVAGAVSARALLLSQVRFRWRRGFSQNKSGELWGDRSLTPLERPGSMTRSALLFRLEQDASYAGNAYVVRDGDTLRRLDPSRVSFIMRSDTLADWTGSTPETVPYDAEVVGLAYHDTKHGDISQTFSLGDFAHWAPEPDPIHWWRGASWVTAVMREILTDGQAVDHTGKFFENAATPNMVFKFPEYRTNDEIREFADTLNRKHAGTNNAYRNMFLAGGADVQVVGSDFKSLEMKDLTGGFETRIASRARIPGVILGIREGYAGSSLNVGNYNSARRVWADGWFTPTTESLCAALESVVPPPGGSDLHYDPSMILFLQEDQKDAADILQTQAVTMRQLVEAGFDPATVTEAVTTGDMTKLKHTGNVSVQLQPPGSSNNESNSAELYAATRSLVEQRSVPSEPSEVHVHVPEQRMEPIVIPAPVVNVAAADPTPVTVENVVNVDPTPVTVNTPDVTLNVDPTPVTIDNTVNVDPTPVNVEVASPEVTVMPPEPSSKKRVKFRRDNKGDIVDAELEG